MRERVFAGQAPVGDRKLSPATYAELLPKHVAMRLDRPGGDAEPLRNLVVRAAGGDENDHVTLPFGNRRIPLDCRFQPWPRLRRDALPHHCPSDVTRGVTAPVASDRVIERHRPRPARRSRRLRGGRAGASSASCSGSRRSRSQSRCRRRGGVWFRVGAQQLHVGVEPGFAPARKAHPGLHGLAATTSC